MSKRLFALLAALWGGVLAVGGGSPHLGLWGQVGLGLEVEGCALGWARLVGGASHPHPASEGLPGEPGPGAACPCCGSNNAGDAGPARQPAIVQGETGEAPGDQPPCSRACRRLGSSAGAPAPLGRCLPHLELS